MEVHTEGIIANYDVEGVTYSGGEPMAQAEALSRLTDMVRKSRDLGVVCYSGYTWEYLRSRGTADQQELLSRVDLLIDGVYLEGRHADLLWRGSANQRLLPLTARYLADINRLTQQPVR